MSEYERMSSSATSTGEKGSGRWRQRFANWAKWGIIGGAGLLVVLVAL